jgi:hypothetical protein
MADALLAPSSSTATEEVTTILIVKAGRASFGVSGYIKEPEPRYRSPARDIAE